MYFTTDLMNILTGMVEVRHILQRSIVEPRYGFCEMGEEIGKLTSLDWIDA
jgi:hypothetical protein